MSSSRDGREEAAVLEPQNDVAERLTWRAQGAQLIDDVPRQPNSVFAVGNYPRLGSGFRRQWR
jgi:hypothetical protein